MINLEAQTRAGAIGIVVVLLLLVAVPAALTRWRPVELTPLRQQRAFGQLVRAARQLYGRHWRPLVLIGLTSIPIVGVVKGLEWLALVVTGGGGFGNGISNTIGSVGEPIGFAVVAAAVITFVRELERGEAAGFVASYRGMLERFWRVVLGQIAASLLVLLLALTVIGIPIAIWKYVSWQFVQQEILFKDKPIQEAFRGSSRLVRGRWWRTVRVAGFPVAGQRRHGPGAGLRADLFASAADLDQRRRDGGLRAAGPLRRDRPHAALLRPRRA